MGGLIYTFYSHTSDTFPFPSSSICKTRSNVYTYYALCTIFDWVCFLSTTSASKVVNNSLSTPIQSGYVARTTLYTTASCHLDILNYNYFDTWHVIYSHITELLWLTIATHITKLTQALHGRLGYGDPQRYLKGTIKTDNYKPSIFVFWQKSDKSYIDFYSTSFLLDIRISSAYISTINRICYVNINDISFMNNENRDFQHVYLLRGLQTKRNNTFLNIFLI